MLDLISKRLQTGTGPIGVKGIKPISGQFKPRKCVKTVSYRGRPRYICPASGGEQAVHSLESLPVKPEDVAQKLQEVKTLSPEEQYTPKEQREHPEKIQEALFRKPKTIHYDTPHEAGPDLTHDHAHFHKPEEAKPKESDAVTAKDVKESSPKKKKKEKDEDVSKSLYLDSDVYFGELSKGDGEWKFLKEGPAPTKLRAGDKMSLGPTEKTRFPDSKKLQEAERKWHRDKASEKRLGVAGEVALTFLGGGTAKVGVGVVSKLASVGGAVLKKVGPSVSIGNNVGKYIVIGMLAATPTAGKTAIMTLRSSGNAAKVVATVGRRAGVSDDAIKVATTQIDKVVKTGAEAGKRFVSEGAKKGAKKVATETAKKTASEVAKKTGASATPRAATVATAATSAASLRPSRTTVTAEPSRPSRQTQSAPPARPSSSTRPSRPAPPPPPVTTQPDHYLDESVSKKRPGRTRRGGGDSSSPKRSLRRPPSSEKSRKEAQERAKKAHKESKEREDRYSQIGGKKRRFKDLRVGEESSLGKSKSYVAPFERRVLNKKTSLKQALDRVPWWMQDDLLEHVRRGKKKKK